MQQQLLSSSMKTFKPSASSASNLNPNTNGTNNNNTNLVEDQEKVKRKKFEIDFFKRFKEKET